MINDNDDLVLIDFGHRRPISSKITEIIGTAEYRPKEVGGKEPYSVAAVDIYCLTNTILIICNKRGLRGLLDYLHEKYNEKGFKEFFFSTLGGDFKRYISEEFEEFKDLIFRALNPDPSLRPTIEEFLACHWINSSNDNI